MAATPSLVPDPAVIAVQGLIFLTAVIVVKKLMLEPYNRLRSKRDSQTTGSTETAKSLIDQNQKLTKQIEITIAETIEQTKKQVEESRRIRSAQRDKILSEAEAKATEIVNGAVNDINREITSQETHFAAECKKLTTQIVARLIQT